MNSLAQLFRELGPARLSILAGVGLALLATFIVLSFRFSSVNFSPLYTNLEARDTSHIIAELESRGVPYKIEENGTIISAPTERVLQLRMMLAENGLPSSGAIAGYEIFDSPDSLGTSNFVHNVNLLRALEGELGRTIGAFENVDQARVHLVIPKRELFARQKSEPTASVVLQMQKRLGLSGSEVKAISHLVATAVPGLKVANITIVDTKGRPFKLGAEDENDAAVSASNAEEYRTALEGRMKSKIEELLERSVGIDRVKAKVSADIDFDRVVTNSEIYDPDGQVVRSVQTVEEKEASAENSGDNVSVENNLPNANADSGSGGAKSSAEKIDETINYEISKRVENHIKESGTVKRLSIAVLIDGTYQMNEENEEMEYQPRTEEELEKLKSLVVSAVGFNEKRGDTIEVVNMRFTREVDEIEAETPLDWIKGELHNILQTFVVAIVVILVILLVIRPMVSRAFELTKVEEEEAEFEAALKKSELVMQEEEEDDRDPELVIDLEKIENRVKLGSLKNINEIVEKYPEEALSVIRGWLHKD